MRLGDQGVGVVNLCHETQFTKQDGAADHGKGLAAKRPISSGLLPAAPRQPLYAAILA